MALGDPGVFAPLARAGMRLLHPAQVVDQVVAMLVLWAGMVESVADGWHDARWHDLPARLRAAARLLVDPGVYLARRRQRRRDVDVAPVQEEHVEPLHDAPKPSWWRAPLDGSEDPRPEASPRRRRATARTPCPVCERPVKRGPGARPARHQCPHGAWCAAARPAWSSSAAPYGCSLCRPLPEEPAL